MKSIMHSKSRQWRLSSAPVAVVATLLLGAVTPHAALASVNDTGRVIVGTDETMTVEIASDTIWDKSVFVDGVLRKTGSGKLTIAGEKLYGHGRIEVVGGELAVTATGAGSDTVATPSAILAGAAMWLDASQHVEETGGSAAKWFDVREQNWNASGFTTNFIYAEGMTELATDGLLPSCDTDEAGRSYINFGGFGSGQYMLWRTPDGAKAWIPVFQSFVAYNPNGSHGNYLGSATSTTEDSGKQQYFATTTGVQPGTFFAQECNSIYNHLRNGRVFRNGERVSVSDPIDRAALQILETESYPEGKGAEAFFNYRNYQASSPNGVSGGGNRVGGGRLHEVLVFTNKLDETDRVVVGHWLLRKWVNQSGYGALPGFSVAQGATLSLPGQIASATAVASDGVVRINGGVADLGTANVADAFAGIDGIVELSGGAIVTNRADAAFVAEAGKSYAVDAWNAVAVSAGTSGEVRKTGAGTLALAGLDSATSVAVDGGAASVRPPFSAGNAVAISPNVVVDGGFEGIIPDKHKNYTSGQTFGAWTSAPYGASQSTRVARYDYTDMGNHSAGLEGSYFLVLKCGGAKQTVSLSKSGRYEVTLRVAERAGRASFARIYVDGVLVGTAQTTASTVWDFVRFETSWLSAGSHELKIVSETTSDTAICIDDIQMRWLDSVRAVAVENGNFEDADWAMGGTYSAINNAIANSNVLSSAYMTKWAAAGGAELLRALPYLRSNSKFEAPVTGTGSMSAFLPKGASLTQTVTVPEDGLYRLSALLGRYVKSGQNISQAEASVRFTLGSSTETLSIANASVKRVSMSNAVRLSAGDTVTVSIASEDVEAAYNNVVVDDVLLERLDNLVANPGFEGGGANNKSPTGWTVAANPENKQIIYDGSGNNESSYFGTSVAEGVCRARMHAGTRLEQTIPLAAGLYRLSFWNVSRVSNSRVYYGPSPIRVTLAKGGVTNFCATVTPSSSATEMMRREFLVRVGEAGNWTLGFFATADTDKDLSSFIDAVSLVPADGIAADAAPDAGNEAMFAVAAGATLGLDWPGVVNAARVRVAGRSLPEGVATAASAPESLYGIGAFNIQPRATTIILR